MTGLKMANKVTLIIDYLDILFPNPVCELTYSKDYELLIAVMLSAQSTDKTVNKVTPILFHKYKTLEELDKADIEDIKKIIKPVGTFNVKAKNIKHIAHTLINKSNGIVPCDHHFLTTMDGVGRKTANVVLNILYDIPTIAVDTHVSRVSKRLKLAKKDDDVLTIEKKLMKKIPKEKWNRFHLQMVLFGRYYCKASKPECSSCKIKELCIER